MSVEKKRVFVGGLFHGVTEQQVCERFNKFGQVDSVSVRVKTDETGQPVKTFAYVDITASEKSLRQCMQVYNKSKWKGSELQLQFAKESFLERLKKEQKEVKEQTNTSVEKSASETEQPSVALKAVPKKATPGTLVGEEKTWVVGKYGRVLPIVNIRRKDKKRVKKLDTTAKVYETEKRVDCLTWQLKENNSLMTKLRTGQVAWKKPVKIKKTPSKMSPAAIETDCSPKRLQVSIDNSKFEIVKANSMCDVHQQDDDEAYSSADTEEMITQMKSSSMKTRENDTSHSDKGSIERMHKSSSVQSTTRFDILKRADISAISPIGAYVSGSVVSKPIKRLALKTSTPKDVGTKKVCNSDTGSDSSLERVPPKKKKKLKPPKIARHNESDSSQDTDDIISDLRHKVGTPRNAWTSSERSLYVTADDDTQPSPEGRSQAASRSDDDDEDVFDLIESGRIDQLYMSAKSSPSRKEANDTSHKEGTEIDGESTSNPTTAASKTPVSMDDKSKKDDANQCSSNKIKSKKNKVKKVSESTPLVTPVSTKSDGKGKKEKKEKSTFAQKFDKRKLSNAQRVTSVNKRLKEARSQKFLIKKALSVVDKTTSSKKIIFDSSDEEDDVAPQAASISEQGQGAVEDGTESSDESSHSDDSDTHTQEDKVKKNKGLLFDSDSGSSESEAEDQQMFQLRPEFEGKAGSKLMKLQARFRSDQRFKLDKRFLESDSDGDSEGETSDHSDDLEEGSDERARSLAILRSVVGEEAVQHIIQRSKKKAKFKDVAALHYDPSREDHKHFELDKPITKENGESDEEMMEKTSKKKKKKKKDDGPSKEAAPPPEKLPEKFFEVSGALKDLLKPAEMKSFSLLSMFGSADVDHSDVKKKLNDAAVSEKLPVGQLQWQPQFGSDDSDEETDGASLSVREETNDVEPVNHVSSSQEQKTFFFVDNDPRIVDGIKSFCRPADWEATREKWLEKRPDLVEDYRMKRKRAIRKGQSQSQRGKFGRTQRGGRR